MLRLGLQADADAGAIRRAYARELKLIDQASQALQFQQLRDAYEAALRWAAHAVDTPMEQATVATDDVAVNAEALASDVYEQFVQACVPLRHKDRLRDHAGWEDVLRRHLADPRLLDLSAGEIFERKIADSLASNWSQGSDVLFEVAAGVFGWEADSRRMQQLGCAGHVIARSLEQRYLFECQEEASYKVSRNVLVGLRLRGPPLTMRLRKEMPHLEAMLEHFPDLIAVTAGMDNLARWRALHEQLTPAASSVETPPIRFTHHRETPEGRTVLAEMSVPLTIVVLLIALVRVYFALN